MSETLSARVAEILAQRRAQALEQAQETRDRIYAQSPELYRIDAQYAAALGAIASGGRAQDALRALQRLQEEKERVLSRAGLTPAALEPQWSCALCRDTGYRDGRRCECYGELLRAEAAKSLPASLVSRCRFESFDLSLYPDDGTPRSPRRVMTAIFSACRTYAEGFSRASDSLLFFGAPGLGKTHLSIAIAASAAQKGFQVCYSPAQQLIDRFERVRFDRAPSAEDRDVTSQCGGCDLLVIDDLGAEFVTSFSQSVLYNIVNGRLVSGAPTIVSTNLSPEELAKVYSERTASRLLFEYKAYCFCGRDIRKEKS